MIRFLNLRSLLSLALLLLVAVALVSSVNNSIEGLSETGFMTVAIIGLVMAYVLGLGNWPAYRSWIIILFVGPPLIFLQVTHTGHEVGQMLLHLPELLLNKLFTSASGQSVTEAFFETQLDELFNHLGIFLTGLTTDNHRPGPSLLELLWSIPLFVACIWSGWWSSHRNSILFALIPSLALHAYILNYAHKLQGPTLQISVFILIVLMGLHQKWSLSKSENKAQGQVHLETYARLLIFSFVLALAAGMIPIIPAPEKTSTTPEEQPANQSIATRTADNNVNPITELPQQHPVNTPPPDTLSVVFLANVAEEPILGGAGTTTPVRYYWRSLTYDQYDGKAWSSSPGKNISYSANQTLFEFDGQGYRTIHQTIIKASSNDKHLFWSGSLLDVNQPIDVTWRTRPSADHPLLSMDMFGSLTQSQQYSADSLLPQSTEAQLRAASQAYPAEIVERYLTVPNAISKRVRDLAVTLTSGAQNPYDKAEAIETYLRTYPYTLDVPPVPANREIADYFLFELKTGYCDYYATSMVVLARAAGLPARIVMGYVSNEYDPQNKQYIVRGTNAHSWAEIYFPDLGWIEFEPTANQPLIERPLPPKEPEVTATPTPSPTPAPTPKNRDDITYKKHGRFVEKNSIPSILMVILTAVGICLLYLHMQGLRFYYKTIGSIYKYIYHHGKKIHRDAPLHETPSIFAEKLKSKLGMDHRFIIPAADELEELTSLYLQETYSPYQVTKDERKMAVKTWRKLFWRLLYARMILRFGRNGKT